MSFTIYSEQLRGLETTLTAVVTELKSLEKVNNGILAVMRDSTDQNFAKQCDPDGISWVKSFRAKNENGQTLRNTGLLQNSINFSVTSKGDEIQGGSNLKYAAIHQFGGEIRAKKAPYLLFRFGKKYVKTKSVKMPKRAYIGVGAKDIATIKDVVEAVFKHIWGAA